MARQIVNVGAFPNDNTGDKVRDAHIKINSNFFEIYTSWITSQDHTIGDNVANTFINSTAIAVKSVVANGSVGNSLQVLHSNGTGIYWGTVNPGVNVNATYAWTNSHSHTGNVTYSNTATFNNPTFFNGNVTFSNTVTANGSVGTNGQILTSNGSGVYWKTVAIPPPTSQFFIADGNPTYILALTVVDQNSCIITVDGLVQVPGLHYTIAGTTLTFLAVPIPGSTIECRNFELSGQTSASQFYSGDGFSQTFTMITAPTDLNLLIVTVDGLVQVPTLQYTILGVNLTLSVPPAPGAIIEVRTLARIT